MSDQLQESLTQDNPVTQDSVAGLASSAEPAPADSPTPDPPPVATEESPEKETATPEQETAKVVTDDAQEAAVEEEVAAAVVEEAPEVEAQAEEKPETVEAQAEEKPEAVEAQAEEKPEAVEAQAEEKPEAVETQAVAVEEMPQAEAKAEEKPVAEESSEADKLPLDVANQTPEMLALCDAMMQKRAVDGQVIGWNKGGYHVAIGRVAAFCPVSQIEIGNPRSPKRYLDKTFKFHVIEIQKGGRRVVLSRAEALKAEREAIAADVRANMKSGMVLEGKISSITDFGAFVDLGGGIEGLVHVSEISRKRVDHPKEVLKSGQEVKVSILKIEKGGKRISLSMKRLEQDPWHKIRKRFEPGDTFSGAIVRKTDFGLFVEVDSGLEGLVHSSRLPLGIELEDESLEPGVTVEGWIHEIDVKRRRLSLSLRPVAKGNPWHGIEERYPEGTVIQGKVERLAPFGAFIELEPGLTGLLPFSVLGQTAANPKKQFHPGKEVPVRVLAIDREKRRISLGTEASKAEGSHTDYREYKKRQKKSTGGLNAMAAAFEKMKERSQA